VTKKDVEDNKPETAETEKAETEVKQPVSNVADMVPADNSSDASDDVEAEAGTGSGDTQDNTSTPSTSTELAIPRPPVFTFDEAEFEQEERGYFGGTLIFLLIVLFSATAIFWAMYAELDEQVRAEGNIVPPSDVQIVQAVLPGVITEINVELGSQVSAGDVMFRMEDKQVEAEFSDNEINRTAAQIAAIRLQAEASSETELNYPEALVIAEPLAVERERVLFLQKLRSLQAEIEILEAESDNFRLDIAERQAVLRNARRLTASLQQEYDLIKPLVDAGHEPQVKLIEVSRRLAQAQGEADIAQTTIESTAAKLAIQAKRIDTVKKKYVADASAELVRVQTELAQAESRQALLAGRVGYAEVKAPHDGTVSALHLKTVGAVVNAGNLLAEIVPVQSDMLVRAKLLPQDIADVSIGQKVRVSLSAYDVSRYGSLEGVVSNIATNTTEDEQQPPYYETFISIENPVFTVSQIRPEVIPGMQVTVDIIGGKRTVLDYILSPIKRASNVAFREI